MKTQLKRKFSPYSIWGEPFTTLILVDPNWRIALEIRGGESRQGQRTMALAVFRRIKPILRQILFSNVKQWQPWPSGGRCFRRYDPVLFQAPEMVTPEERRGFEIRLQRLKRGWTLRELAAASGVSHSRISRIERGRVVSRPTTYRRIQIALESATHQNDKFLQKIKSSTKKGSSP